MLVKLSWKKYVMYACFTW